MKGCASSQHRAELLVKLLPFWSTPLTLRQIAKEVGCRLENVKACYLEYFGQELYNERTFKMRSKGREGTRYLSGQDNPRYDGGMIEHCGYWAELTPDWYTGKINAGKGRGYVFTHILNYCKHHRLTEIPEGYVVHHINHRKKDNRPSNLQLMTVWEHNNHHNKLGRRCND